MEILERTVLLLKNVVFPIKKECENLIGHQSDVSEYQIYVSLHETNGFCLGGLPINEEVLAITKLDVSKPNTQQFIRYVSNLEYIKLNCYGTGLRRSFCCPCHFYCDSDTYRIDILNKSFNYNEFPNEREFSFIINKIKTEIVG